MFSQSVAGSRYRDADQAETEGLMENCLAAEGVPPTQTSMFSDGLTSGPPSLEG